MVDITVDDITMRTNLTIDTSKNVKKKTYSKINFNISLGFMESRNGKGTHKSRKVFLITGKNKFHLKFDFVNGNNTNGVRKPFFLIFSLDKPPTCRFVKIPKIELY